MAACLDGDGDVPLHGVPDGESDVFLGLGLDDERRVEVALDAVGRRRVLVLDLVVVLGSRHELVSADACDGRHGLVRLPSSGKAIAAVHRCLPR